MRSILRLRLLLVLALPFLSVADDMVNLRLRWRQTLTGGTDLDPGLAQVRSRLTSIQSTGRSDWSSLQKAPDRQTLWTDIALTNISADISSTYGRLRDMAAAWAT